MSFIFKCSTALAESGFIPDSVIRFGIRRLVERRRKTVAATGSKGNGDLGRFVEMMNKSEIALVPDTANEQHYELPAEFFISVLGRHRKYSCCYWDGGAKTLDDAEQAALETTCSRAEINDGMQVLDLGCGWGSFSLWVARRYPNCSITAVSNSDSQGEFIQLEAQKIGLSNLRVIIADMNDFECDEQYDRIVSVEMFEHMRNYHAMLEKISRWLKVDGYFFMHIFCHRTIAYEFVDAGPSDWMCRHFFSGGLMPSEDLPLQFQDHLSLDKQWRWDGIQYQKTAEAWLANMDANKKQILPILEKVYGADNSHQWWMRWRMFFLSVGEMFGSHEGEEWHVGHYRFGPKSAN